MKDKIAIALTREQWADITAALYLDAEIRRQDARDVDGFDETDAAQFLTAAQECELLADLIDAELRERKAP